MKDIVEHSRTLALKGLILIESVAGISSHEFDL